MHERQIHKKDKASQWINDGISSTNVKFLYFTFHATLCNSESKREIFEACYKFDYLSNRKLNWCLFLLAFSFKM